MTGAKRILKITEQSNIDLNKVVDQALYSFIKRFKIFDAAFNNKNEIIFVIKLPCQPINDKIFRKKIYKRFLKIFKNSQFAIEKPIDNIRIRSLRHRAPLMFISLDIQGDELKFCIHSYLYATISGIIAVFRDAEEQLMRLETIISNHHEACDILIKGLRLTDFGELI